MQNPPDGTTHGSARRVALGRIEQALSRLADALEQSGPQADAAHAHAFASVLNLVGERFLDGQADFIDRLVARLEPPAGEARRYGAWVHFMDQFAGYVLQGEQGSATRHVFAMAALLTGVPAHRHVGRIESTEAIAAAASQALFGRPGCVRVARDLQEAASAEPDFFGFLRFYAARHEQDDPADAAGDDVNFSDDPEADAAWAALDDAGRAAARDDRGVLLAVCVEPPEGVEDDHGVLMARLNEWAAGAPQGFAVHYRLHGSAQAARIEPVAAGAPFSTAAVARSEFARREAARLAAAALGRVRGAAVRAVVSLLALPDEIDAAAGGSVADAADASERLPLVRPSVALFAQDDGRLLAGAHFDGAPDLSDQVELIVAALEQAGVARVEIARAVRPEPDVSGLPAFYDLQGRLARLSPDTPAG